MKKRRLPLAEEENPLLDQGYYRHRRRCLSAALPRQVVHFLLVVALLTDSFLGRHTRQTTALLLAPMTRQCLRRAGNNLLAPRHGRHSIRRQHLQTGLFFQQRNDPILQQNNDATAIDRRHAKHQQLMDASTLSLAPMMDYTDRHFRHLVRLVSNRTLLYTEMVAANAIAHERRHHLEEFLVQSASPNSKNNEPVDMETAVTQYNAEYLHRFLDQGHVAPLEGPSVLQLGGSDPDTMYEATMAVQELAQRPGVSCDYTALNLNCGCPSPKVAGKGCFGAALMEEPHTVAALVRAMHEGSGGTMPVTVKCRIGTDMKRPFVQAGSNNNDDNDAEYGELCRFIETVAADGIVTDFQIHARIAVLQKSLSPAANRNIPPLKYNVVRRLVQDYPTLTFSLNGGIETIASVQEQLQAIPGLQGVMIGRAWAADPWSFAMADELLYGQPATEKKNRWDILQAYGKHADAEESKGDPVRIRRFIVKAVTPLFTGEINAKRYRIALDEIAGMPKKLQLQGQSLKGQPPLSELILNAAMRYLSEETLFRSPQESYERVLWEESKRSNGSGRSQSVTEWQTQRATEEVTRNNVAAS